MFSSQFSALRDRLLHHFAFDLGVLGASLFPELKWVRAKDAKLAKGFRFILPPWHS
ncbi:MAG: hypothetical protein WCK17_17935 [Verrucomicrobiota bacterium]